MGAAISALSAGAFAQSPAPADRVLYDLGMQHIEHGDYAAARLTLKTPIDAQALAQAEAEYKDFILFYPSLKEAADLQVGGPLRKIREQKATKLL